jgi:hypothetical protein
VSASHHLLSMLGSSHLQDLHGKYYTILTFPLVGGVGGRGGDSLGHFDSIWANLICGLFYHLEGGGGQWEGGRRGEPRKVYVLSITGATMKNFALP